MLYLFEISKKWAFRICMGLGGGGGVGDHIFSQIRAEVGRFQDFGLSVQNTQVANWGLSCFVHCSVICGVTRKHLHFRNRHIETHEFTLRHFFPTKQYV